MIATLAAPATTDERVYTDITFPYAVIALAEKYTDVDPHSTRPVLTHVHVSVNHGAAEAADGFRLAVVPFTGTLTQDLLIPRDVFLKLKKLVVKGSDIHIIQTQEGAGIWRMMGTIKNGGIDWADFTPGENMTFPDVSKIMPRDDAPYTQDFCISPKFLKQLADAAIASGAVTVRIRTQETQLNQPVRFDVNEGKTITHMNGCIMPMVIGGM